MAKTDMKEAQKWNVSRGEIRHCDKCYKIKFKLISLFTDNRKLLNTDHYIASRCKCGKAMSQMLVKTDIATPGRHRVAIPLENGLPIALQIFTIRTLGEHTVVTQQRIAHGYNFLRVAQSIKAMQRISQPHHIEPVFTWIAIYVVAPAGTIKNLPVNNINGQRYLPGSNDGRNQVIESQETAYKLLVTHEQFVKAIEPAVCNLDRLIRNLSQGSVDVLNRGSFEIWSFGQVVGRLWRFCHRYLQEDMLRVDYDRWSQTSEMLRQLATTAEHARTRERFLGLYEVTQTQCATEVAWRSKRNPQTVMRWIHRYNESGPEALIYRRSGGRPPFAARSSKPSIR